MTTTCCGNVVLLLFISFFVISCYCVEEEEGDELVSVVAVSGWFFLTELFVDVWVFFFCFKQIFRHGDRTPVKPYPNDPYKNQSFWPVDFGQLTNVSCLLKKQLFENWQNGWLVFFFNSKLVGLKFDRCKWQFIYFFTLKMTSEGHLVTNMLGICRLN